MIVARVVALVLVILWLWPASPPPPHEVAMQMPNINVLSIT